MWRRLLVPAASTAAMLAVLLGLGVWQLHRLAWKQRLLAEIAAAERAPPVPLPPVTTPFQKVSVSGRLRGDLRALYGAEVRDQRSGPVLGGQLLVPMVRDGATPVIVDLGWVPADRRDTVPLADDRTTVAGFVRPAEHPGLFSATDNPQARLFYTLDPVAVGAALGLPSVAPFTLVALGPTPPAGFPDPARALPRPPNDHLQYALTWFGLAGMLLVVFGAHVRKVLRP
jgi:surfeit locus 1 family protein